MAEMQSRTAGRSGVPCSEWQGGPWAEEGVQSLETRSGCAVTLKVPVTKDSTRVSRVCWVSMDERVQSWGISADGETK